MEFELNLAHVLNHIFPYALNIVLASAHMEFEMNPAYVLNHIFPYALNIVLASANIQMT
jgi:hypothetical protein